MWKKQPSYHIVCISMLSLPAVASSTSMCSAPIRVIHSIPAGEALIENVLRHYPIGTPLSCRLYKRGLNDTYLVETKQDRYILRFYRKGWRTKPEIDSELELLAFLHERNLPVAYPIERKGGGFTEELAAPEGNRYAAVFSYAPGRAVSKKLESEQSRRLGEVLATLHTTMDDFTLNFSRPALSSEYLLDCSLDVMTPLFQHRQNDIAYLQKQIEKIKRTLVELELPFSAPTYGICIGDVHSENAHFTDKGEPTLFDFDQCGYGWRAFDIAKFIHTSFSWKIDDNVRKPFLDGYQALRQLSEAEFASIPVLVKVAHIWVMGINCEVAGEVVPYGHFTDEWFDASLALLTQLDIVVLND
jgi:Ser/Thr protein kinase RdoA (MazF antagonist)